MYGSSPGEPRTLVQSVDAAGPKKKPTSFQITSVTVQGSRLSNDGGDESADDLDESHTEDLSSDILDCSKTTDTEQLSPTEENGSSAATAPAPPAPAEAVAEPVTAASAPSDPVPSVGLAAVTVSPAVVAGAAGTLAIVAGAPAAPSATEGPINPDHWQRRFKVVKIVSSEPFGRGRWLCMDFVDPPAMQGDAKAGEERESGTAAADLPPAVSNEAVAHVYEIPVGQTYPTNSQQSGPLYGIILPVSAGGQGASPLGVLQPIAEQATAAEQPAPVAPPPQAAAVAPAPVAEQQQTLPPVAAAADATAQAADPVPENANKSATEEDSESTSAGSTVAIDNKIEQAMDLVKSHLMFAVREEVDVLKEKITELLDRIAQLEYENGILRAGASPETLSLLAQPAQQVSAPPQPVPQPQQTLAAVAAVAAAAAAAAQPVAVPPQPQAPVAAMQPIAVQQQTAVQPQAPPPPQLGAVVQQPQQLQHPQQQPHPQQQQPSQPLPLQPHQPQQQQQQKQPLQQPPT
uniref:Putative sequence-specific dna binding transcription factor n=1 Tax=Amblyomma aureolatum TaxID=187763 RepID=A0A1E1XCU9_9ACAR